MKGIIIICTLLALANAGLRLDNLEQQEGSSCMQNPVFVVSSFDVQPWPPTSNINLAVNMTGTFNRDAYVNQLQVGTNYNRQQWHYQHYNVNENFSKGQTNSFTFSINSGQYGGSYVQQVTLSTQDHQQYQHLTCWQFNYQL
ncbi:hypothetical protein SteCoe_3538 [Stentor coeruleus]|uniref:MD-2-related lipid-recognition domain-containing protein n=1 Tax=Stentor coeruleus TaxID=5963 RepID=A0A1R2CWP7_9CILI|nr:hypothetical protein SteCoe_3538 [Stentor coeruleus]